MEMMQGLMQDDFPLTIQHVLNRARTVNANREIVSPLPDGGIRRTTFSGLAKNVDRLCTALARIGVQTGDRVATLAWNTQEHVEAYLGVPAMGAVLHTVNVRLHPDQIVHVINHGGARVLIVDETLLDIVSARADDLRFLEHLIVIGNAALSLPGLDVHLYDNLETRDVGFSYPEISDRAASGLCYTSGTTGNPRGVLYSHRSTVLHAMGLGLADTLGVSSRDRVLPIVPMFHANGWGLIHAAPLIGADLILPGRNFDAGSLANLMEQERVTISGAVPTVWSDLLSYLDRHEVDLHALHTVSCGGAPAPQNLLQAFDRLGINMVHAWGMTEISPLGSVARAPRESVNTPTEWEYRSSQGRLLPLLEARLLGPDGDMPFDGTSSGELLLRGPWVAAEYYKDDEASAERFYEGWLRTGDIATITSDGYLRIVDRVKDLIKSGGEWISSLALENSLMDHPAVQEACVVAKPDARWTERPYAFVVLKNGVQVSNEELRQHLSTSVVKWWIPDWIEVIDAIPKSSVGKFDKAKLRGQVGPEIGEESQKLL